MLIERGSVSKGGATQVPEISRNSTRYCLSCQGKRDLQPPVLAPVAITWRWPIDKACHFLAWSRQAEGTSKLVVVIGAVGLQLCSRPSLLLAF